MINNISIDSSALIAKSKSDLTASEAKNDFLSRKLRADDTAQVAAVKPVASPLPAEDLAKTLEALFNQFDVDGNNTVSNDELLAGLKSIGFSEEGSKAVASLLFTATNDVDGDLSISRNELDRIQKLNKNDSFAYADLDNNGSVSEKELTDAIDRYSKIGKVNRELVFEAFNSSDADKNGILTRDEFESAARIISDAENETVVALDKPLPAEKPLVANKPIANKPIDFSQSLENLFAQFDVDGNGGVSREELYTVLSGQGVPDDQIKAFADNLFSSITDVDKNGELSLPEAIRRREIDVTGVVPEAIDFNQPIESLFARFDTDKSGNVSKEELYSVLRGQGFSDSQIKPLADTLFSQLTDVNKDRELNLGETIRRQQIDLTGVVPETIDFNQSVEQLFTRIDADKDNSISRKDLYSVLRGQGFSTGQIDSLTDVLFSKDTDVNQDGLLTLSELLRRQSLDVAERSKPEKSDAALNNVVEQPITIDVGSAVSVSPALFEAQLVNLLDQKA